MLQRAIILSCLVGLVGFSYFSLLPSTVLADADTLAENQIGNTQVMGANSAPFYNGQTFRVADFGYIREINFYGIRANVNDINKFALFKNDGVMLSSTTITNTTTTDGTVVWTLADPVYVAPNRNYFFGEQAVSGSGIAFVGTSSNPYANGCVFASDVDYTEGTTVSPDNCASGTNWDIVFEVSGSPLTTTIGTPTSTVAEYDNCRSTLTFSDFFSSSTLYAFGCILFIPDPDTLTFFNNTVASTTEIFPFSILFQFNEITRYALDNYASSSGTNLVIPIKFNASTTQVIILGSSSINQTVGTEAKQQIDDWIVYSAWLVVAWLALRTILPKKKK